MSQTTVQPEYLRAKNLGILLNCAESTIWRKVKNGELPPPDLRIGKRQTLWRKQGVLEFLRKRQEGAACTP